MSKMIEDIDVYRLWLWTDRQVSFKDFKESILKVGYVIYSIESEGKLNHD